MRSFHPKAYGLGIVTDTYMRAHLLCQPPDFATVIGRHTAAEYRAWQ